MNYTKDTVDFYEFLRINKNSYGLLELLARPRGSQHQLPGANRSLGLEGRVPQVGLRLEAWAGLRLGLGLGLRLGLAWWLIGLLGIAVY